ncbi:MAG: HMA2 domain-containing protein [Thiobacillaceae bacterium]
MPPDAIVVHRLPGRLRLRLTELRNDPEALANVAARLRAAPGILGVEANAVTGSLLIRYEGADADVMHGAAMAGGFRITTVGERKAADLRGRLDEGMRNLSRGLQTVTGGEVDLNGLLVVGLTLLAIQQAIEGNVMVPAAALLWNAYQAARMPRLDVQTGGVPAPPPASGEKTAADKGRFRRATSAAKAASRHAGSNRSHRKGDTR